MKGIMAALLGLVVIVSVAWGGEYRYVTPKDFHEWLDGKRPVTIVDIQPADDYRKQHFDGSIETNAYPVKTDSDRQKLEPALSRVQKNSDPIVIVCPRGGGGARGTYDYLKGKGVDEKRLFILEGGMAGWPYREVLKGL